MQFAADAFMVVAPAVALTIIEGPLLGVLTLVFLATVILARRRFFDESGREVSPLQRSTFDDN